MYVRSALTKFIELNSSYFTEYCHPTSVKYHVDRMSNCHEWGTHTEIFATSLYLKIPVFVALCKICKDNYYWAKYQCPPRDDDVVLLPDHVMVQLPQGCIKHIELCHVTNNHYDCIVMSANKSFSQDPPYIGSSSSSIVI